MDQPKHKSHEETDKNEKQEGLRRGMLSPRAPSPEVSEVSCELSGAVTSVWHSCLPWEGAASAKQ
ncbi:hypothetical protein DV515_00012007 [Chloebia gouldiae]|uniref:Uncharacterized protein n=1 Tax=Chloebia gouldiae TaxID=44316 RepID=A0A3L8S4W9_CHLGU|nr:hypothetical protein DV515_00012007 [Chloebia gouldiae]